MKGRDLSARMRGLHYENHSLWEAQGPLGTHLYKCVCEIAEAIFLHVNRSDPTSFLSSSRFHGFIPCFSFKRNKSDLLPLRLQRRSFRNFKRWEVTQDFRGVDCRYAEWIDDLEKVNDPNYAGREEEEEEQAYDSDR
jgi:hypothetical protein